MNVKQSAKLFLGSLLVYVAMASCVASEKAVTVASTSSGVGGIAGATGGGGGGGGGSAGSGGIGGIVDPVPDANAEPLAEPFYQNGTRLKFQYWQGEDGARVGTFSFFDTSLMEQCTLKPDPAGVTRCMPMMPAEPWSQYVAFELKHD